MPSRLTFALLTAATIGCGDTAPAESTADAGGTGSAATGTATGGAAAGTAGTAGGSAGNAPGGANAGGAGGENAAGGLGGAAGGGAIPIDPNAVSDKVDLLLMVDNSFGMTAQQVLLQQSIPELIARLGNPFCSDANGIVQPALTPATSAEPCPDGLHRAHAPVTDVNLGIITSSLGGFGATSGVCMNSADNDRKEDMSHLLGSLPRGSAALLGSSHANAAGLGFLEWRGGAQGTFDGSFSSLLGATGEFGCGFEASLEAWYRFLIDPEPYLELVPVSCGGSSDQNCRAPSGIDQAILDQRAAFLRPDSVVAVLMLTDENDCSVKTTGQAWYVVETGAASPMWRATPVCETDPNNTCCYSCGQAPPAGCNPDPACGDPANTREPTDYYLDVAGRKDTAADPDNLRCFHQKQRFGIDFLFPTQRYSNALLQPQLCITRNDLATSECSPEGLRPNPLYVGSLTLPAPRTAASVFLAGIVGVPWQDLARDPAATGELSFKTYAELVSGQVWDLILGDGTTPADPFMQESRLPRTGTNPVTGTPIEPPTAAYLMSPINGHDWQPSSDLQHACTFPLLAPLDCAALEVSNERGCACFTGIAPGPEGYEFNPLCQAPDGSFGPFQHLGKAHPSLRPLQVLKDYGAVTGNSVVASTCPRNTSDATRQDYGYRPAMQALVEQLAPRLPPATP